MDKQQEESRKQFEKYFDDTYGCHPTDSHDQRHVEVIWHVWQASRASIVVELPHLAVDKDKRLTVETSREGAFNLAIIRCKSAIRSIGLSIKGE